MTSIEIRQIFASTEAKTTSSGTDCVLCLPQIWPHWHQYGFAVQLLREILVHLFAALCLRIFARLGCMTMCLHIAWVTLLCPWAL